MAFYPKMILTSVCWALLVATSVAQIGEEDVFPELYGQEAQEAIQNAYTPGFVLDYGRARDTLFSKILGKQDSLTCVYSGHRVYMNPAEDPTTTVYQNGGTNGINTEHTWPQAYGAGSGPANSNMYHLFPTRIKVNEARANYPFAEIADQETQAWFYLNQSQSTIPNSHIDDYSEYKAGLFEPREDFKGDIARAMFYFYTIYRNEAQAAPANFFSNQAATLYQWHLQDPVGTDEWNRNSLIATYQDDKSNPFILDRTLIGRAYCDLLQLPCMPTATSDLPQPLPFFETNYPNPFDDFILFNYYLPEAGEVTLSLYNSQGQKIEVGLHQWQSAGAQAYEWQGLGAILPSQGLFWVQLEWSNQGKNAIVWQKIIRAGR